MIIPDRSCTAREAARRFGFSAFDPPRDIGTWKDNRFRLADGIKWYEVREHVNGWEIVESTPSEAQR